MSDNLGGIAANHTDAPGATAAANRRRPFCRVLGLAVTFQAALAIGQVAPAAPAEGVSQALAQSTNAQTEADAGTDSATVMPTVKVTADLDRAREQIAPELGAVSYTIGPEQIQAMGQGENAPLQQVVLQSPGVVADEFGEVHVRGDHGDIQYRVNGVLLPESLNGFAQEVDTHLIRSVTLLTGTLPAQFGFRTAGIFDITTKTGAQLNGNEFSLYGGSHDTFQPSLQLGGVQSQFEYFVTLSYLHDDLGIDNTSASNRPLHDLTNQRKAFGYFSYRFDPTSRLTLLLSGSRAQFQIPDTGELEPTYTLPAAPGADSSSVDENQHEQNYYVVLSYQKYAGDLSYQVSVFTRDTDIRFTPDYVQDLYFGGIAEAVKNTDRANGMQADISYELNDRHTIRSGFLATYDSEHLDSAGLVFPATTQFAPSPDGEALPSPVPQTASTPGLASANSGNHGWTAGLYLQDEWHPLQSLILNYGARFDLFDTSFDHEGQISPRVNLVWQIDAATTAHVGYARYFMPPTLQHIPLSAIRPFEYTTGAPFSERDDTQRVERDNYFDVGLSRQITSSWQVDVDSFCKLARNLLDVGQFGNAVILDNFNYRKGTVYGAELSSTYKKGNWSAYGNFSYVQTSAQNIDSAEFEFPNNELAYLSNHHIQLDHQDRYAVSGGASYSLLNRTRIYSDLLYGNGLRANFANLDKLPAYWTMNVGVEHVFHLTSKPLAIRDLRLRFDCLNLLDKVYELRNGTGIGIAAPAYGPRRGFYGGITAVF